MLVKSVQAGNAKPAMFNKARSALLNAQDQSTPCSCTQLMQYCMIPETLTQPLKLYVLPVMDGMTGN